jgi:hypothetical protein
MLSPLPTGFEERLRRLIGECSTLGGGECYGTYRSKSLSVHPWQRLLFHRANQLSDGAFKEINQTTLRDATLLSLLL